MKTDQSSVRIRTDEELLDEYFDNKDDWRIDTIRRMHQIEKELGPEKIAAEDLRRWKRDTTSKLTKSREEILKLDQRLTKTEYAMFVVGILVVLSFVVDLISRSLFS